MLLSHLCLESEAVAQHLEEIDHRPSRQFILNALLQDLALKERVQPIELLLVVTDGTRAV